MVVHQVWNKLKGEDKVLSVWVFI